MARYSAKMGRIILRDKSKAHTFQVDTGPGDLKIDGIEAGDIEALPVFHRGVFDGMLPGIEKTAPVSFTAQMKNESLSSATQGRFLDFIRKTGSYSTAVTTDPGGLVWAFEVEYQMNDGAGNQSSAILPCVRASVGAAEAMEGNSLTFAGTGYRIEVTDRGRCLVYFN
jgi:hypothetical protein